VLFVNIEVWGWPAPWEGTASLATPEAAVPALAREPGAVPAPALVQELGAAPEQFARLGAGSPAPPPPPPLATETTGQGKRPESRYEIGREEGVGIFPIIKMREAGFDRGPTHL